MRRGGKLTEKRPSATLAKAQVATAHKGPLRLASPPFGARTGTPLLCSAAASNATLDAYQHHPVATPRFDPYLGTMTDQALADRAGVKKQTITARRVAQGIDSWRNTEGKRSTEFDTLLGICSDTVVAELTGVGAGAILKRRRKKNILTYRPRTDSPKGIAVLKPAASSEHSS